MACGGVAEQLRVCNCLLTLSPPHSFHPALPQSVIELARTQDEEVGDGTTSVIILGACRDAAQHSRPRPNTTRRSHRPLSAGEMLHLAEPFLEQNIHPTVVVRGA